MARGRWVEDFVVLGYGVRLVPELCMYLDYVIKEANLIRPKCIFLTGGESQRGTNPGRTEARVMHEYLLTHDLDPEIVCVLEEKALSTVENLLNVSALLQHHATVPTNKLRIFCEATRKRKVSLLASRVLPEYRDRIFVEPVSWEKGWKPFMREIPSTAIEYAALYWPAARQLVRELKEERALLA